jgi:HlyD family secretion protein
MRKGNIWISLFVVLLLAAGGGYAAYNTQRESLAEEPPEPTLETATVTQGDIVITADGSGELVPATEQELTFRTGGVLAEMLVDVGDQVQKDEAMARLETDQLERAVAEAEVELELAQLELANVREGPSEADLADAQAALRDAQVGLSLAYESYRKASDSNLDAAVETTKADFDWWVGYYQSQKAKYEKGNLSQADHDWAMNAMISAEGRWQKAINDAKAEQTQASSRIAQAQNAVYQAEEKLKLLESEPLTDTLMRAELAADQALLALEQKRTDLEAAQLYAPFDGIVMDVMATVGEQVGANTAILSLADFHEPLVRFWVEESDLGSVAVGKPVNIVFEAFPDDTSTGKIIQLEPVLVTVDGASAVQTWASVDLGDQDTQLLSGMTADVEIIAAEARNTLLVPVEALRETSPGQYAVLVVKPDGELEMRTVVVGLRDVVNAEILEGLELGDVVSIGKAQ